VVGKRESRVEEVGCKARKGNASHFFGFWFLVFGVWGGQTIAGVGRNTTQMAGLGFISLGSLGSLVIMAARHRYPATWVAKRQTVSQYKLLIVSMFPSLCTINLAQRQVLASKCQSYTTI
jgi:hypothetical protein